MKNVLHSTLYKHSKKMKLMMICAILTNTMDSRNTFLQTLLGLAQGLRDKGFKLLNSFGVLCSIFHIRKHGGHWARVRSAVSELNPFRFWRLTLDNLDFRAKFAKKMEEGDGGCVLNRMFHLLTSQVSFRKNEDSCSCSQGTLKQVSRVAPGDLKENHLNVKH